VGRWTVEGRVALEYVLWQAVELLWNRIALVALARAGRPGRSVAHEVESLTVRAVEVLSSSPATVKLADFAVFRVATTLKHVGVAMKLILLRTGEFARTIKLVAGACEGPVIGAVECLHWIRRVISAEEAILPILRVAFVK